MWLKPGIEGHIYIRQYEAYKKHTFCSDHRFHHCFVHCLSIYLSRLSGFFKSHNGLLPCTTGTSSKFFKFGGEVVAHSSVNPSHGSLPAFFPLFKLFMIMYPNCKIEIPIRNAPMVEIIFKAPYQGRSGYV